MDAQIEKITVEKLIYAYSEAVNEGNHQAISAFYTQDGLLIPDGFKPVLQGKSTGKYFTNTSVQIGFTVNDVVVEGTYAFVEARAKTTLTDLGIKRALNKNTRDLFILKNTEGGWKIYRYIFNSESQG